MEIPFVARFKWFYAGSDWVLRECGELSVPVRIDRPVGFEISAQPTEKLFAATICRHFDCIVDTNETCSSIHLFLQTVQMGQRRVAPTTVRIDHNRIGGIQHRVVGRPTVLDDFAFCVWIGPLNRIRQNSATCIMFV